MLAWWCNTGGRVVNHSKFRRRKLLSILTLAIPLRSTTRYKQASSEAMEEITGDRTVWVLFPLLKAGPVHECPFGNDLDGFLRDHSQMDTRIPEHRHTPYLFLTQNLVWCPSRKILPNKLDHAWRLFRSRQGFNLMDVLFAKETISCCDLTGIPPEKWRLTTL
jgi:hypothetical protein